MAAEVALSVTVKGVEEVNRGFGKISQAISSIGQQSAKTSAAVTQHSHHMHRAAATAASGWENVLAVTQRLGIASAALGAGLLGLAGMATKAAEAQQHSVQLLAQSLRNIGIEWALVSERTQAWTAELQRLSGFTGSELRAALSRAIQITKDYELSLKTVAVATDLAAGTGLDLQSSTVYVSRALAGSGEMLRRYGIFIKDSATQTEILTELHHRFGGAAEANMRTAQGAARGLRNAINDLQAEFGAALLPAATRTAIALTGLVEHARALSPELKQIGAVAALATGAIAAFAGTLLLALPTIVRSIALLRTLRLSLLMLPARIAIVVTIAVIGFELLKELDAWSERNRGRRFGPFEVGFQAPGMGGLVQPFRRTREELERNQALRNVQRITLSDERERQIAIERRIRELGREIDLARQHLALEEARKEAGQGSATSVAKAKQALLGLLSEQAKLVQGSERLTALTELYKLQALDAGGAMKKLSQIFSETIQRAELLARINHTSNAVLADQLQVIHDRFAQLPKAAKELSLELLGLQARIVELRDVTDEFMSGLNLDARQAWEQFAARAEAAATSVYGSLGTLREGLTQSLEDFRREQEETADLIARFNQQAIEAIEERMEAQRREAEQVRQAIQDEMELRQIGVDIASQLFEMGRAGAGAVIEARQRLIEYITSLEQTAMGTEAARLALTKLGLEAANAATLAQERMRQAAENIGDAFQFVAGEIKETTFNWVDAVRTAAQDMQQSMSDIFFDTMRGNLRSLADLFDAVLSALQRQLANWLASQVVQQFTGLFGGFSLFGGGGGGGGGGTLGIRPMQTGGRFVVNRPTLMAVGETGTEEVDVRPLARGQQLAPTPSLEDRRPIVINITNRIEALEPESFSRWLSQNQDAMADSVAAAMKRNHYLARMLSPEIR